MSDELMQSIAAQHNLSEQLFRNAWVLTDLTALVHPRKKCLCADTRRWQRLSALDYRGDWQGETLTFETASGEIYAKRSDDGLSIEFPSVPMIDIDNVAAVEQALGATVISMHQPEEGAGKWSAN